MNELAKILQARLPAAPHAQVFDMLSGDTALSADGFPVISEKSFALFLNSVPHLFEDGRALLRWLKQVKGFREKLVERLRPELTVAAAPAPKGTKGDAVAAAKPKAGAASGRIDERPRK